MSVDSSSADFYRKEVMFYLVRFISLLMVINLPGCTGSGSLDTPADLLQELSQSINEQDPDAVVACFDLTSESGKLTAEALRTAMVVPSASENFVKKLVEKYPEAVGDKKYNALAMEAPLAALVSSLDKAEITIEGNQAYAIVPRDENAKSNKDTIVMVNADNGWLVVSMADDLGQMKKLGSVMKKLLSMFDRLTSALDKSKNINDFGSQFQSIYMDTLVTMPR